MCLFVFAILNFPDDHSRVLHEESTVLGFGELCTENDTKGNEKDMTREMEQHERNRENMIGHVGK